MSEDKNSGLIFGIIVGAIVAIILLSRKSQPVLSPLSPVLSPSAKDDWKPMDIPRVDDIKPIYQQDPKIIQIESQLQRATSQIEHAAFKLQELQNTISKLQEEKEQPKVVVNPVQIEQPKTIYQPYQPLTPLQVIVQPISEKNEKNLKTDQQTPEQQVYKNNEKWEIKRGSDGRIKSLNIIRDVKKIYEP